MRHFSFFLILLLPLLKADNTPEPIRVHTWLNGHVERWDVEIGGKEGSFEIGFKNDPNTWRYICGERDVLIETYFKDHFSHWQYTIDGKRYDLETQAIGSWTRWQLTGDSLAKVRIETFYGESWDNWRFDTPTQNCVIATRIHKRFEDWEVTGPHNKLSEAEQIAATFMPIIIGRIQQKGLFKD